MKTVLHTDKRRLLGYIAGILAGVSYGTNPLFGKALMESGVPIMVMLFFRYAFAAGFLAVLMMFKKESFLAKRRELVLLILLGLFFAGSSITLFCSYEFIPSGLATTLIYLYPVIVALIMVFLRIYPSWQTWLRGYPASFYPFRGSSGSRSGSIARNRFGPVLFFLSCYREQEQTHSERF